MLSNTSDCETDPLGILKAHKITELKLIPNIYSIFTYATFIYELHRTGVGGGYIVALLLQVAFFQFMPFFAYILEEFRSFKKLEFNRVTDPLFELSAITCHKDNAKGFIFLSF